MSENGEIYTAGKNFTLPPALTAWTNSTSAWPFLKKSDLKEKVETRPDLFSSQFRTGANMIAKRIGEQI